MGNKYHSRSPQELREYLDSLNPKPRKRTLFQYVVVGNIFALLFVLFVYSKENGFLNTSFKPSNKIQLEELEAYFVRSNESTQEETSFFFFLKNQSQKETSFPKSEMQVIFTLTTEEKEECLQKKFELNPKKILPKNTEFFPLLIEEKEIKKTKTCDTFFHKIQKKNLTDLFAKGNSKFTPELMVIYQGQIYRMSINN